MEIRREIRPRDHKIKMVNAHKNKRISRNSVSLAQIYAYNALFPAHKC